MGKVKTKCPKCGHIFMAYYERLTIDDLYDRIEGKEKKKGFDYGKN